jgi:hypothetical protein
VASKNYPQSNTYKSLIRTSPQTPQKQRHTLAINKKNNLFSNTWLGPGYAMYLEKFFAAEYKQYVPEGTEDNRMATHNVEESM